MVKYKKSLNTNNIVSEIMKLDTVKEVLEMKEEG
jgi:hypothetical protein